MPHFLLEKSNYIFPHPYLADKDGFLAMGGDLSPQRILSAYQAGIFPWYNESTPILWFSTHPRLIIYPDKLKISKSMKQLFRRRAFDVSIDTEFSEVIEQCAKQSREGQDGTWITDDLKDAFVELHDMGYAHSVEVWDNGALVGGLYGLSIGRVFFGESMFALKSNASKYGFISLANLLKDKSFELIDCQQDTPHLRSFGAELISQGDFHNRLKRNTLEEGNQGKWTDWISGQPIFQK